MAVTTLDSKTALIIIDLQRGILTYPTVHPIEVVVKHAGALAEAFRRHDLPVVLVNAVGGGGGGGAGGRPPPPDRPFIGSHVAPHAPYRVDGKRPPLRSTAPMLGEHNEQVLRGDLGLSQAEIDRLEQTGVIGTRAVAGE